MSLDIRLPIGYFFALVGIVLVVFGLISSGSEIYQRHSLGINVNLWWGLVLLLFGLAMAGLAWRAAHNPKPPASAGQADAPPRHG